MSNLLKEIETLKNEFINLYDNNNEKIEALNSVFDVLRNKAVNIFPLENKPVYIQNLIDELFDGNASYDNGVMIEATDRNNKIDDLFDLLRIVKRNIQYYSKMNEENQKVVEESFVTLINQVSTELERLKYLILLEGKNTVLLGANGSGKSSFASFLKKSVSKNIIVVPAQKILSFYDGSGDNWTVTNKEIREKQIQNLYNILYHVQTAHNELALYFTELIKGLCNEHIKVLNDNYKENKNDDTLLGQLNDFFSKTLSYLRFEVDAINRKLLVINNNTKNKTQEKYDVNFLSDGEKVVLYYALIVISAPENSIILLDEPETFLNLSISNRVWDVLEELKESCKFIYISHNVDFIVSRTNASLYWCKSYNHPNTWEIEALDDSLQEFLPNDLIVSIIGSSKPILFCEGTRDSYDLQVYTALFGDKVMVYPVGGHREVISYTKTYNSAKGFRFNKKAYGIIDGDLNDEKSKLNYLSDNIFVIPFNEIEMFFVNDELINAVTENSYGEEGKNRVTKFKEKFFQLVDKEKEKICAEQIRFSLNNKLNSYRVNDVSSLEASTSEVKKYIDGIRQEAFDVVFREKLSCAILKKNYSELLELVTLKGAVAKDLANKFLDSDYEKKAMYQLKYKKQLCELIVSKYFEGLNTLINDLEC